MGNCVVNVQYVERLGLENFEHFRGKRERIRRMVEERVGSNFDFVKVNARIGGIHADRRGVADEVDVVAASRKFLAKLGRDNAGTAVSGVASYADAHRIGAVILHFLTTRTVIAM